MKLIECDDDVHEEPKARARLPRALYIKCNHGRSLLRINYLKNSALRRLDVTCPTNHIENEY